jgi:8-oxo-dGTP diphosphatase
MRVRPAALIIQDNALLTMRYRYGDREVYMLPGGNPDPGETLREALQRELHEELGLEVQVGTLLLCGEVIGWGSREDTLHCVFEVPVLPGTPVLNPEQTSAEALVWVPVADAPALTLYPQVGEALLALRQGTLPSVHVGVIEQPYVE